MMDADRLQCDQRSDGNPAEFVRDTLLEKQERLEAAAIREAILEGYQDAIAGRTVPYRGDLRRLLRNIKHPESR
jgi:hypothetical protein